MTDMHTRLQSDGACGTTGGAYTVGASDTVHRLEELPKSCTGAPLPHVIASEHSLHVIYRCAQVPGQRNSSYGTAENVSTGEDLLCVVEFDLVLAHFFGPPNDEAFEGHPLAKRGLEPYGSHEVKSSSWIHAMERMNAVHRSHEASNFDRYRHFILTFHDSTFECAARGYVFQTRAETYKNLVGELFTSR